MKVHHLNCGSIHARLPRVDAIIYCLLIEMDDGLILVDTGFGTQDYVAPSPMMRSFLYLMGSPRNFEETALFQIRTLGFFRNDVRHIVLTHLHLDHAGGLPDFPDAAVHVYAREYESAMKPRSLIERGCDSSHWNHDPNWVLYEHIDNEWFGFESIQVAGVSSADIRLIPLPGHTRGHCGVAVKTPQGWLFDCGDAASPLHFHSDLHRDQFQHEYLRFPNWIADWVLGPNIERLRKATSESKNQVKIFSAHDVYMYQKLCKQ